MTHNNITDHYQIHIRTLRPLSIFTLLTLFIAANPALSAQPTISNIEGSIISGNEITITGNHFGESGPNIILFDDFSEETPGTLADNVAKIGSWTRMCGMPFADDKLSTGIGLRVVSVTPDTPRCNNELLLGGDYSEIYVSSIAYIPDRFRFPGTTTEETWPDVSALKHLWVYDSADGYIGITEGADIFSPAWTGKKFYNTTSNDVGISSFDQTGDVGWTWDQPVRWSLWIKGNGTNTLGSNGLFQSVSANGNIIKNYRDYKAWFVEGHPKYSYDRIHIPGYIRYTPYSDSENYIIDDVYVAVGKSANARIELGNHPIYEQCTKLIHLIPTAWSDTLVSAKVSTANFNDSNGDLYLFITSASEERSVSHNLSTPSPSPRIDNIYEMQ